MENNFIRPQNLKDFVGKEKIKENLSIYLEAAKKRKEVIDHVLIYGPAGLGKTSLGYIIANEMKAKLHYISAPSIEKNGDLAAVLSTLNPGDILFVDEIHRLPKIIEEMLYSAMEDFRFNILVTANNETRNLSIDLPPFTLIGATTRCGDLSSPLRDRFGIHVSMDYYNDFELSKIILNIASVFKLNIDEDACNYIASRSRGTPRIALKYFKRIRDFCTAKNLKKIDIEVVQKSFEGLGIDEEGLDENDRRYLSVLGDRFAGGPVGLKAISNTMNEDSSIIEDVIEPFLLRKNFINRTNKGRILTSNARSYILKTKLY